MAISDEAFKQYAKEQEQKELEKANRSSGVSYTFEKIKWTGLEPKKMKIVRALGGVPDSKETPFTARRVQIAYIRDDKQKRMRVILPLRENDSDFILWRIIDQVLEVEWIDKVKHYVNETRHPAIFKLITKNGYEKGDRREKFDTGWTGKEMLILNCIDRTPEIYQWQKENKHSVLLSRNINIGTNKDGNPIEYIDEGLSAYGIIPILSQSVLKFYGDWREYDIGIERTGLKNPAYRVINACKHIEEVPDNIKKTVSDKPLTDEELAWQCYDLDKLFKVTSYTKLWMRLQKTIANIDVAFGTSFGKQLKAYADEEAEERKKSNIEEPSDLHEDIPDTLLSEEPSEEVVEEKSTTSIKARTPLVKDSNEPEGFKSLSLEERVKIKSFKKTNKGWEFEYTSDEPLFACQKCMTPSPQSFSHCPNCGMAFTF